MSRKPGCLMHLGDFANMLKAFIGSNYLGVAYAFKKSGLVYGIIGLVIIASLTDHCCHLIIKAKYYAMKKLLDEHKSKRKMQVSSASEQHRSGNRIDSGGYSFSSDSSEDELTASQGRERNVSIELDDITLLEKHMMKHMSYGDVGRVSFGRFGFILVNFFIATTQFCFCVAYFIFIGNTIHGLLPTVNVCHNNLGTNTTHHPVTAASTTITNSQPVILQGYHNQFMKNLDTHGLHNENKKLDHYDLSVIKRSTAKYPNVNGTVVLGSASTIPVNSNQGNTEISRKYTTHNPVTANIRIQPGVNVVIENTTDVPILNITTVNTTDVPILNITTVNTTDVPIVNITTVNTTDVPIRNITTTPEMNVTSTIVAPMCIEEIEGPSLKLLVASPLPLFLIFALIRSIRRMSWISIVANVSILGGCVAVFAYIIIGFKPNPGFHYADIEGVPVFFGMVTAAFEGIGLIIPVESSMEGNRHNFNAFLHGAVGLLTFILGTFGIMGYMRFAGGVAQMINLNIPSGTFVFYLVNLGVCVGVLLTFPLQIYPVIELIEIVLFSEGSICGPKSKKGMLLEDELESTDSLLPQADKDLPVSVAVHIPDSVPAWKRNIVRFAVVMVAAGLAVIFRDSFAYVGAFTGAVGSSSLAYILPCLFHYQLCKDTSSRLIKFKDIAIIIFGITASVISLYYVMLNLIQNTKV